MKDRNVRRLKKVAHASRLIELGALKQNRLATTIISSLSRCGEKQRALAAFALVPSPNIFIYNAAISACEKGSPRVLTLLDEMKARKIEPDVISYNAAISACEKGSPRVLELFDEMKARKIEPDVISYSAAISACEKGSPRVLELFDEMKARKIEPDD